jgi:hypothetical protein
MLIRQGLLYSDYSCVVWIAIVGRDMELEEALWSPGDSNLL